MPDLDSEVQKLFDELLKGMKSSLKNKWDHFVSQDLTTEINKHQAEKGYSDLLRSQKNLSNTIEQLSIQKTQHEESKKSLANSKRDLEEVNLKISEIDNVINSIRSNYNSLFKKIFQTNREAFKHRFSQLKPKELFNRLWAVHSWLAFGESSYWSTSPSVKIIEKMIGARFLKIIPDSAFQKNSGTYSLNQLGDAQKLTENECRTFWAQSSDIFELSCASSKITITPDAGFYQRFQLYAFFKGHLYINPKNVLVLNFDELRYYQAVLESDLKFSNKDIVLLNLGAEEKALWVLMMRINQSWHVYLPKEYETQFNEVFKPRLSFLTFEIHVIDLDEYQQFNPSFVNLSLHELWVCVMVSRLYPALLASKNYINYRQDMAPHILLELTKNAFRISSLNFFWLAPYSLLSALNMTKVPESYLFQDKDDVKVSVLHRSLNDIYDYDSIQLQKMNGSAYYNQLTIKKTLSDIQFFQCIELSERLKLTRIDFDANVHSITQSYYSSIGDEFIKLLDFNPTVTEVTSKDNAIVDRWISELYFASARNRFLKAHDASYDDFSKRKELWNQAGIHMRDYLQQNDFNLDFVNQVMAQGADERICKYVQIAQMGKRGLDVLFDKVLAKYVEDWNSLYQEPAPQLYGLFDLYCARAQF